MSPECGEERHLADECNKVDKQFLDHFPQKTISAQDKLKNQQDEFSKKLQEQQLIMEQRLQEQQTMFEQRLQQLQAHQKENRNSLGKLWKFTIFIISVVLVLNLGQDHSLLQDLVNVTQTLNNTVIDLSRKIELLENETREDKAEFRDKFQSQETTLNRLVDSKSKQNICPGSNLDYPATSCQQILNCNLSSSSGYYWIKSSDSNTTHMYCSMNRVCGGVSGGWMRVADLDMRNNSHRCLSGLRERVHSDKRLCSKNIDDDIHGGCSHTVFKVNDINYDRVCGKIIAYQFGGSDSFGLHPPSTRSIDKNYLDGISLTYSMNPRTHIWSFVSALDEVGSIHHSNCPCTNISLAAYATLPPDFVRNDYFCDTGSTKRYMLGHFYADDPLWDGAGCGPTNFCCSLNNPPWFFKQLQSSTSENIEMRVCCDYSRFDEDVYIEQIEIYVS